MQTFKEGDYVSQINSEGDYYKQSVHMKKLMETICIDDEILTYRNNVKRVIRKFTFTGFSNCSQIGYKNYECCKICKGYLNVKNSRKICPGRIISLNSSILKIIKNENIPFLDDKLFKI